MLKHSLTWLTLDKSKVFGILWVYIDIVRIKCSWLYTPVDLGLYTICLGLYTVPGFIYIEQGGIWRWSGYFACGRGYMALVWILPGVDMRLIYFLCSPGKRGDTSLTHYKLILKR